MFTFVDSFLLSHLRRISFSFLAGVSLGTGMICPVAVVIAFLLKRASRVVPEIDSRSHFASNTVVSASGVVVR